MRKLLIFLFNGGTLAAFSAARSGGDPAGETSPASGSGSATYSVIPGAGTASSDTAAGTTAAQETAPTIADTAQSGDEARIAAKIESLMAEMNLKEKIGQLFLVSCPADADDVLANYSLGGFALFRSDFAGKSAASKAMTAVFRPSRKIPMLLAVDERGAPWSGSAQPEFARAEFKSPRELLDEGRP
jgi:hypothetical protein